MKARAGDVIFVSGDLGRHCIAIVAVREGLEFETVIEGDCAAGPIVDKAGPVLQLAAPEIVFAYISAD